MCLIDLKIEMDSGENSVFSNASAVVACRRSARRGAAAESIVIFVDGSAKSVVHAIKRSDSTQEHLLILSLDQRENVTKTISHFIIQCLTCTKIGQHL